MSLKALSFRRRTLNPSNFKRTQDARSNLEVALESKWDLFVRSLPKRLRRESGLFARENISEGTVVASFGAVRALRKGEVGTRTRVGKSVLIIGT